LEIKPRLITGEYYFNLLTRLDEKKIHEKDPVCKRKKIIFYQDNAPAHKSILAMGKLRDLHYEMLEHLLCSPDLAPSDFCLFPKLKLFLAGQLLSSIQKAIKLARYTGSLENIPPYRWRISFSSIKQC
jgi:histone-lysine N-methyltransferase SETMAR